MKILSYLAGAFALALSTCAVPAAAQTQGSSVQFPAGWAPGTSVCVKQANGTCLPVSADVPLPTISTATPSAAQADPGANATKASAVQGVDGGKPIAVNQVDNGTCTINNATAVGTIAFVCDTIGYRMVVPQITGVTAGTVAFEQSNDCTNYVTALFLNEANSTFAATSSINQTFLYKSPAGARCYRGRVTTALVGTPVWTIIQRQLNIDSPSATQLGAGTASIGNILRTVFYNEQVNAAQAANVTFSGASRDWGTVPSGAFNWSMFNCFANVNASGGTLRHEGSIDAAFTAPVLVQSVSISTAGVPVSTRSPVFLRYNRCAIANGANAATASTVSSSYSD